MKYPHKIPDVGIVSTTALGLNSGGSEYTRKVCRELCKYAKVTIYSFDDEGRKELENTPIKIVSIKRSRFNIINFLKVLNMALKMEKHDALFGYTDISFHIMNIYKILKNPSTKLVAVITHVPGGMFFFEQIKNKRNPIRAVSTFFGNKIIKKFDSVITISEHWKKKLNKTLNIPLKNIRVAYVGSNDFKPSGPHKRLRLTYTKPIIYTALLKRPHNTGLIVKALPIIKSVYPETSLIITGRRDERYYQEILNMASRLGVKDSVHYIGIVPNENLEDIYKQSDIVTFVPTDDYGWSIVLLRGMYYKKPCIASEVGALKELIEMYDGLVVPNNPEDFAKAVISLLKNDHLRNGIVKNAYRRLNNQTWEKAALVHYECIKNLSPTVSPSK